MRRLALCLLACGALWRCSCGAEPITAVTVVLRVAPATVDFGSVPVGAQAHRSVSIADDGNGPFVPASLPTLAGDAFAEAAPCTFPIAPGAFCQADIVFAPQTEGALTGTWTVHGPDADIVVALTGRGDPAQVVVDPPALDYGQVRVGSSIQHTFTVTNQGTSEVDAPLIITGDGFFSGGAARQNLRLAAGTSQTVAIDFSPSAGGDAAGSAVIEVCGPGCGPTVTLTGTGVAPRIDVEPRTVDFGAVAVGAPASTTLTVTNSGAGDLVVTGADLLTPTTDLAVDIALPLTVATGASATLAVTYTPTGARGALGAGLRITSNDPVSPTVLIPIDGHSEGPALEVLPHVANLGALDAGDERTVNVVIRSIGTVPADITGVHLHGSGSFAFVSASPPTGPLAPLASLQFPVRARATTSDVGAGGAQATLVVSATGVPDVTLPLAFLSGTTGCQPRVPAPNVALGSVVLNAGTTGGVTILNVGDAACTLDTVATQPAAGFPFDSGFSFSAVNARTIPPGGQGSVEFAYQADVEGQRSAFVAVKFLEEDAPLLVSATARGVTGTLVGVPPLVTIGPIAANCQPSSTVAQFVNTGGDPVTVTALALDVPTAPFQLSGFSLPTIVVPGTSRQVHIAPTASAPGFYAANVVATSDVGDATVRLEMTVTTQGAPVTETFQAGDVSAVDVLFVVDNSGSMADDQDRLATNFNAFIASAFTGTSNVDFHLGATTTDVITGTGGPLVGPFLTRGTGDLANAFAAQVRVGTDGLGIELGLEAMHRALGADANTSNAGFLRQNAALSIIIISDEEDNGGDPTVSTIDASLVQPVELYTQFLHGLKGGQLKNAPILVSVVVTLSQSQRYQTVANEFGGVVLDIQDASWGQQLSQIGAATFGLQRLFRLGSAPDPSTVTVAVNGVPTTDFTVVGHDVVLGHDPPAPGEVSVTYAPGCP